MPAYLVFICQTVEDREELETYWKKAPPTFAGYEFKPLGVYTPFELLEGDGPVEGVVIAEFGSMEEARRWYYSPEYAAARSHRELGARYIGLLVDGGMIAEPKLRMPRTR
jgi:uncharacterized protein (DUF1330 family)